MEASLAKRPNEVVPYKVLPDVVESIKQVVSSRLRLFKTAHSGAEVH
jgi:fructose-bisphosphate aldolase class II